MPTILLSMIFGNSISVCILTLHINTKVLSNPFIASFTWKEISQDTAGPKYDFVSSSVMLGATFLTTGWDSEYLFTIQIHFWYITFFDQSSLNPWTVEPPNMAFSVYPLPGFCQEGDSSIYYSF